MQNLKLILIVALTISLSSLLFIVGWEKEMTELREAKENNHIQSSGEKHPVEMLDHIVKAEDASQIAISIISKYYYLLNKHKFEDAYEMLLKEYIEDFDISENIFRKLQEDRPPREYIINEIKEYNDAILVECFIKNNDGMSKERFSIQKNIEGEYKLTLNGMHETGRMNVIHEEKEFELNVIKYYRIYDKTAYMIHIKNNTSNELSIEPSPFGIYGEFDNQQYSHKLINSNNNYFTEDYVIAPNSMKEFICQMNSDYSMSKIGIKFSNGNEYNYSILIN